MEEDRGEWEEVEDNDVFPVGIFLVFFLYDHVFPLIAYFILD